VQALDNVKNRKGGDKFEWRGCVIFFAVREIERGREREREGERGREREGERGREREGERERERENQNREKERK
jgi:hypothetical protein